MLAYTFKMICVMVIVETVLKWCFERLCWEFVLISWLNDVFEWWFYEIVLKFLLNEVLEGLFFEFVMKWWWKCREGCRVMMMMGRWARPTLTYIYIYTQNHWDLSLKDNMDVPPPKKRGFVMLNPANVVISAEKMTNRLKLDLNMNTFGVIQENRL